jgi:DNA-directed RNA polymerase subunit RPC12/RpoP
MRVIALYECPKCKKRFYMTKKPEKKRKYICPHCGASIAIGEKTKI